MNGDMMHFSSDGERPETSSFLGREPALILAAVQAVLALAVGFGLDVTAEQVGLIMAAAAALLGFATRSQVSPKL